MCRVSARSTAEVRTKWVLWLAAVTMVVEIAAGWMFNSMTLLADGWHMASHVGALGIALAAYAFDRRYAGHDRFTFGTGKVGALAGCTSAVGLGLVAALMVWESAERLVPPQSIAFDQAMMVAVIVSVVTHWPRSPEHCKAFLDDQADLIHVTVEVHAAPGDPCLPLT